MDVGIRLRQPGRRISADPNVCHRLDELFRKSYIRRANKFHNIFYECFYTFPSGFIVRFEY